MSGAPALARLRLVEDADPHPAPLNMALDEVLLAATADDPTPVLRVYRWSRPAVSFGYFEPWAPVRGRYPEQALVRRWTGGGVVEHGDGTDWTYSLLVPRAAARWGGAESYAFIHAALAEALRRLNWAVELASDPALAHPAIPGVPNACFSRPVRADVLFSGGTGVKVAGAAQRRTRAGRLHQGSVLAVVAGDPAALADGFAARLAGEVSRGNLRPETLAAAERLAWTKYGDRAWTERC